MPWDKKLGRPLLLENGKRLKTLSDVRKQNHRREAS